MQELALQTYSRVIQESELSERRKLVLSYDPSEKDKPKEEVLELRKKKFASYECWIEKEGYRFLTRFIPTRKLTFFIGGEIMRKEIPCSNYESAKNGEFLMLDGCGLKLSCLQSFQDYIKEEEVRKEEIQREKPSQETLEKARKHIEELASLGLAGSLHKSLDF